MTKNTTGVWITNKNDFRYAFVTLLLSVSYELAQNKKIVAHRLQKQFCTIVHGKKLESKCCTETKTESLTFPICRLARQAGELCASRRFRQASMI